MHLLGLPRLVYPRPPRVWRALLLSIFRSLNNGLISCWPLLALAAIVLSAGALAMIWVFQVPIYMAPDEPMNLDFALAIHEHGGLFWMHGTSYEQLPDTVHPYSAFLLERTNASEIAFHPERKMPVGYGSREFLAALDREAPARVGLRIDAPNKPFAVYPFGYYALLALWIEGLHLVSDKPVLVFFGARVFSVMLFAVSLLFIYGTLRRLHFRAGFAVLVTACVAFFPLSISVASAVQTDNLSFFLVSACFYLALVARARPNDGRIACCLGLGLGALLVTKPHFFLCVLLPTLAMLALEMLRTTQSWLRRLALGAVLLLPSGILGSLYLATTWGTVNYYYPPAGAEDWLTHDLRWFQTAFWDFYAGLTHETFWCRFGWHDLIVVIRGHRTDALIRFIIQAFSWILLALTLLRLEQVASRLLRVARRGRTLWAARMVLSNPLINSYFLFTALMFFLYVRIDNRFGAQGRNWWPLLLPIFLTGIVYAPKALTLRRGRTIFQAVVMGGLLCYCALGSVYSLRAIQKRYYYIAERPTQAVVERPADVIAEANSIFED